MAYTVRSIAEMEENARKKQKEVIDLIQALHEASDSDGASSVTRFSVSSGNEC